MERPMIIDCDDCSMRDTATCDDCVVAHLLGDQPATHQVDMAPSTAVALAVLHGEGLAPPNRFRRRDGSLRAVS